MTRKEKINQTIKNLDLESVVIASNINPNSYDVIFSKLDDINICSKFAILIKEYETECICANTEGLGTILVRFSN